jgi:hypothetical protein
MSTSADLSAPKPPPQATFPSLNLQGILYHPSKPSALINGQTLYVDETIEGAHVVSIERQCVTVDFNGQRKVLALR